MLRRRTEGGAAAVETALCLCFVVLPLVFGIISYAYMLSFRQSLSQAAVEGARAAAVLYTSDTGSQKTTDQTTAATTAVSGALSGLASGMTCGGTSGLTCTVAVATCSNDATASCVSVTVAYPYRTKPLLPTIPGLGFSLPPDLSYTATARVS